MCFKCKFCGKELKTESGFKKHSCKYIKRFLDEKSKISYELFLRFLQYNKLAKSIHTDFESYITSKYYNDFHNLVLKFLDLGVSMQDRLNDYFEYCLRCNIPSRNWCKDDFYLIYISDYLFKEDKSIAIARTEKYVKENNIDFNTISENKFYILLKFGLISPYYIIKYGIDVNNLLGKDLQDTIKYIIKQCRIK